jgi:hypothetical protein
LILNLFAIGIVFTILSFKKENWFFFSKISTVLHIVEKDALNEGYVIKEIINISPWKFGKSLIKRDKEKSKKGLIYLGTDVVFFWMTNC